MTASWGRAPIAHRRPGNAGAPSRRGEDGVVGGVEALPFSVLIFVVGTLILVNAWGVVDAKLAATAAAREAARTFVESDGGPSGLDAADRAGKGAYENYGRDPDKITLVPTYDAFQRCGRVTYVAETQVKAIKVPFIAGLGDFTVEARHSEQIDALRSGVGGEGACGF